MQSDARRKRSSAADARGGVSRASLGLEFIGRAASLLDGTFEGYVAPIPPDSPIGKCGVCGKQIKAIAVSTAVSLERVAW